MWNYFLSRHVWFGRKIAETINSKPINKTKLQKINIENYFPKEKTISKVRAKKYICN